MANLGPHGEIIFSEQNSTSLKPMTLDRMVLTHGSVVPLAIFFLIFYSLCWAEVQFLGDNCAFAEGYGAWVGKMEVAKRLLSTALLISGEANSGNME